jgi:hypothetical protein
MRAMAIDRIGMGEWTELTKRSLDREDGSLIVCGNFGSATGARVARRFLAKNDSTCARK